MENKNTFLYYAKILINNIKNSDVNDKASSLAYYLLLSIFPFMIFFLNIISMFFKGREFLILDLLDKLPKSAGEILREIISGLIESSNSTLLSISLVMAIWAGSNGMMKLISAINDTYGITSKSIVLDRIYALFFTLAFAFILVLVFVSLIFGDIISAFLRSNIGEINVFFKLWIFLKHTMPNFFMVGTFSLLYKFSLRDKMYGKVKILYAFFGAIFTSLVWNLLTKGFTFYVNNFGKFDRTYGSIGGVIVLIIWLYISSMVMIIGSYVTKSFIELNE